MYILLKNSVIFSVMDVPCYVKQQINGFFISCKPVEATHILQEENYYSVQNYRLQEVDSLPEGFVLDETWIFEEGEIVQSSTLKKEKEDAFFLESLPSLSMMELSARVDELEEKLDKI